MKICLKEKLERNEFVVTAELSIPKGTNLAGVFRTAELFKGLVDAVNIPDNPRAIMKVGALSVCHELEERGIETILHMTCKDRNKLALQSDLLSAHVLDIRNILAITGDRARDGDHPDALDVFEFNSVGLLGIISTINSGRDLAGKELNGATNFFTGATLNPVNFDFQKELVGKKVSAGAKFFQTQMIYDVDAFLEFMKEANKLDLKIMVGIMPLRSVKMAEYINRRIPGVNVPKKIIDGLKNSREPEKHGRELARETISAVKGKCAGVHIMPLGNDEVVTELIQ